LQIVTGGILLQRKGNNFYWGMIFKGKFIYVNRGKKLYGYIYGGFVGYKNQVRAMPITQ